MKTLSLRLHQFGSVKDALRLEEVDLPDLQPHQVRVEMKAAPINPADLNLIEGKYPIEFDLPGSIGHEGVGVITAMGNAVTGMHEGQHVIMVSQPGNWCANRNVDSAKVVPVPQEMPFGQAAMLTVNPPTAWQMLHQFVNLQAGDWVAQNAANSAVGRWVVHICAHLGVKTMNVVRREELIQPLLDEGATEVILDEEKFSKIIKEKTKDEPVKLGLNAVGGKNATELAKSLSKGGAMVTYGAMGKEPLEIPNGLLIFKDIKFFGFWLTEFYKQASREELISSFNTLCQIQQERGFEVPIAKVYHLKDYEAALEHASQGARGGKVLFDLL